MKNISSCFYLCFNLSIVSQTGRFLSVPCYPTPWKWRNHSDFPGEPGEGKGWEQVVLYLPFAGGLLMVSGGSLSTQVSFYVNLSAWLQAFYCFKEWGKEIQILVWPAASPVSSYWGGEHKRTELGGCQGLHCSKTQQELLQGILLLSQRGLDGIAWLGNENNYQQLSCLKVFLIFPKFQWMALLRKRTFLVEGITPSAAGAQKRLICATPLEKAQQGCPRINTPVIFVNGLEKCL